MIVEIILNNKSKTLNRTFDYKVPKQFESLVHLGARVLVPFGNRKEDGYVINFKETSEFELKEIKEVLPSEELTEDRIKLAKIMSNRYFTNFSECLKLMLNPEITKKNVDNILTDSMVKYIKLDEEKLNLILKKEEIDGKKYITEKQKKAIKEFLKIYDESKKEIDKLNALKNLKNTSFNTVNKIIKLKEYKEKSRINDSMILRIEKLGIFEKIELEATFEDFDFNQIMQTESKNELKLNKEQEVVYNGIIEDLSKNEFSENLIYGVTGSRKN